LEEVKNVKNNKPNYKDNPIIAALILFLITAVVTLALAATNVNTRDIITEQAKRDADAARLKVFDKADHFEEVTKDKWPETNATIASVYKAIDANDDVLGLVIASSSKGYAGNIDVMSGISLDMAVTGVTVLYDNETPGLGKKVANKSFISNFIGKSPVLSFSLKKGESNTNHVDAIAGATISSKAMMNAVNEALSFAKQLFQEMKTGGN